MRGSRCSSTVIHPRQSSARFFECGPASRWKVGRRALTLLEILIAMAILGGAVTAIQRLNDIGMRSALRAELDNLAAIRCQSMLDSIIAGSLSLPSAGRRVIAEDPAWSWSAQVSKTSSQGTVLIEVIVERTADPTLGRCHLGRWVRQSQLNSSLSRRKRS